MTAHRLTALPPDAARRTAGQAASRWTDEQAKAAADTASKARHRIEQAEAKRNRLMEAMLAGAVDHATFAQRDAALRADIAAERINAGSADIADGEIEATLLAGERLLGDLVGASNRMETQDRLALLRILWPTGLVKALKRVGTFILCASLMLVGVMAPAEGWISLGVMLCAVGLGCVGNELSRIADAIERNGGYK